MSRSKQLNKSQKQALTANIISAIFAPKIEAIYQEAYSYAADLLEKKTHKAASFYNQEVMPSVISAAQEGFIPLTNFKPDTHIKKINSVSSDVGGSFGFEYNLSSWLMYDERKEFLALFGYRTEMIEACTKRLKLRSFKKPALKGELPIGAIKMFNTGVAAVGGCNDSALICLSADDKVDTKKFVQFDKKLHDVTKEMNDTAHSVFATINTLKTRDKIIEAMPNAADFLPAEAQSTGLVPVSQSDKINELLKGVKAA